jgi:hypothetical protein
VFRASFHGHQILGAGKPFFANLPNGPYGLEITGVTEDRTLTHLEFAVRK